MKRTLACTVVSTVLLASSVPTALAHCCHDERLLGVAEQDGLRRGVHGMDRGSLDDEYGRRFGDGRGAEDRTGSLGDGGLGGLGQMRGDSIGSYGAGSIGERGPGGLGALEGNFLHGPPSRGGR